jgi:hypothetical protein
MSLRATAVLSVLLATSALTPGVAQEVGVLAAVNRDMIGERPTEAPRQIFLQEKLVMNERIETSAVGGGQVLFLDQTSLTITKNSLIVLDKYVYDPDSDTGEIGVSVLKGAMRIVGGRITKKKAALIRTPSATIGIRGGIGNVSVRPDGSTIYMHVAGISSTIEGDGEDVLTITREGGVAVIQETGEVEYVGVADPETVDAIYNPATSGEGDGQSAETEEESSGGQTTQQQQQQQQERQQQRATAPEEGAEQIAVENSEDEDARDEAPVSTQGERQQREQAETDTEIEDDSEDEQADNVVEEVAEEIADEIAQDIDQLLFTGTFSPTLIGGQAPGLASGLAFQMVYSINSAEGLVLIELPDAAVDGGGSETFDGQAITSNSFIIGGADLQALTAETGFGTLLGGDVSGTTLAISPDINVSGDIDIDYSLSSIVNADSLTADLAPVLGDAVDDIAGASVS